MSEGIKEEDETRERPRGPGHPSKTSYTKIAYRATSTFKALRTRGLVLICLFD